MKVFHIISNKEWGGGEQYVYDLAGRQRADGIEVSVFCRPVEVIVRKFEEAGIPVTTLRLNGITDVRSAFQMASVIRGAGPCSLHAHNFKDAFTAAYARRLSSNRGVRVVMCRHLTRKGKTSWIYRWLYRQLDRLVFDSELSQNEFLSTRPAIDPQKLGIVHTSIVVPDHVEAAPIRAEFGIDADTPIAMFHGRLDAEKGLDVLLEAAAMLSDCRFRLVLIGRGSEKYTAHLKQRTKELGLAGKVTFAGFRQPVLPYVAAADFGILASTVREGCPLSPQEYMSQGCPVIATNNGGQREYMEDDRNGLLVEPGNSRQLADAMRRMVGDAGLRRKLGQQAQDDYRQRLNYEQFYKKIKHQYELAG